MKKLLAAAALLFTVSTAVLSAATIKAIKLADGYDEINTLHTPLFDNTGHALGILGSREAVPVLASRYATEDEDPRYFTLKAMDYIGGPEAEQVVATLGMKDEDSGPGGSPAGSQANRFVSSVS